MNQAERLQKIISNQCGISRREAENWIRNQRVTLNGAVAKLGEKALLGKDSVKVDGKLLRAQKLPPVYVVFHKPPGVVAMMSDDPDGRRSLLYYFRGEKRHRLFPVGRMDFNGEGVLLLTNDGQFTQAVNKSSTLTRVYEVKATGPLSENGLEKLARGTRIEGRMVKPTSVRVKHRNPRGTQIKIELRYQGAGAIDLKTVLIRAGFRPSRIVRTAIGPISISGLSKGSYRFLNTDEAKSLIISQ